MNSEEIKKLDEQYIAHTYARFDVVMDHGKGSRAFDKEGKEYIDFAGGIGVDSLGFCDDVWLEAMTRQAGKLQHISNLYYTEPGVLLARDLCEKSGMKKVLFVNSGGEANEVAIKTARKYGNAQREGKNEIITLTNSFHGRTIATLTATGQDEMHKFFGPFAQGFKYVPANDAQALEKAVDENTCAIMVEMIQGEGGLNVLDQSFVDAISAICKEKDILFIVDEVQTGIGRTGKLFAYQNFGVAPDLVTFAKGIGAGMPIGGCLFGPKTEEVLQPGDHGSTFSMNPAICAGARKVLERLDDDMLADVKEKGDMIMDGLAKIDGVYDISGIGMMIGFKVKDMEPKEVVLACLEKGLLTLVAEGKVRLLPPLIISKEDLAKGLEVIKEALQ